MLKFLPCKMDGQAAMCYSYGPKHNHDMLKDRHITISFSTWFYWFCVSHRKNGLSATYSHMSCMSPHSETWKKYTCPWLIFFYFVNRDISVFLYKLHFSIKKVHITAHKNSFMNQYADYWIYMTKKLIVTHFFPPPCHTYNSSISQFCSPFSAKALWCLLLEIIFGVKYGLNGWKMLQHERNHSLVLQSKTNIHPSNSESCSHLPKDCW